MPEYVYPTGGKGQASVKAGAVIPLLQAGATGALASAAAGSWGLLLSWENLTGIALAAGSTVALLSFLAYRASWQSRLESILHVNLDQVRTEAVKAAEADTLNLTVNYPGGGDFLKLPGGREKLAELARGIVAGKPFTVRAWTGPGGIYSPTEFDQVRAELLARGFLQWRSAHDARGGVVVTRKGWATLRFLAGAPTTPAEAFQVNLQR